jgi:outer membrane protein
MGTALPDRDDVLIRSKEKGKEDRLVRGRHLVTIFLLICLGILGGTISCSGESKIAYVDSDRILAEYKGTSDIRRQFDEEVAEWETHASGLLQEIENLEKELERQAPMLSDEAKLRKTEEIARKQEEYNTFVQEIWGTGGKYQVRNLELTRPLIDRIRTILNRLGEEGGYTLILDIAEGSVVYAQEGLDLTDEVLVELNREFASRPTTEKVRVALLNFKETNTEAKESSLGVETINQLRSALAQFDWFEIVDHGDVLNALTQLSKKWDDELDARTAAEVGQTARAQVVVMGTVTKLGPRIESEAIVVDVATGREITRPKASCERKESLDRMVSDLASKVAERYRQ